MQTFKHRPITFATDAAPRFYDNFTVIFHPLPVSLIFDRDVSTHWARERTLLISDPRARIVSNTPIL